MSMMRWAQLGFTAPRRPTQAPALPRAAPFPLWCFAYQMSSPGGHRSGQYNVSSAHFKRLPSQRDFMICIYVPCCMVHSDGLSHAGGLLVPCRAVRPIRGSESAASGTHCMACCNKLMVLGLLGANEGCSAGGRVVGPL